MENSILTSRKEISEFLKISWDSVKNLIDDPGRKIPIKKIGGIWFSETETLRKWLVSELTGEEQARNNTE